MARGPSGPANHCLCAQFAPLWLAARPRSERSVGGPVIICLLFLLPTFMARGPSGPAFHCLSAQFWRTARASQLIIAFLCNLPPLWRTARPRSERSVGSPVIICLLFHLPTFKARGPSGPAFHCLSAQFSPVMACGPSGPAYHCLMWNLPPLWRAARPRIERSVGGPVITCLLFLLPTFIARGASGPAFIAFLPNFPPLWRAARPRSGRSVGGPVVICPLFHLRTFLARSPSGPAFNCLSAHFPPPPPLYGTQPKQASWSFAFLLNLPPFWRAARAGQLINALLLFIECGPSGPAYHLRGPSRPVCHLPLCLICGAPRPVWKALHGRGHALLFYEGLQPLAHEG